MALSGRNSEHTQTVLEEIYQQAQADAGSPSSRRKARRRPLSLAQATAPLTVALGVLTLALGFWQVRTGLRLPLARLRQQPPPQLSDYAAFNPAALALLPVTDSDGDGLPDAEEKTLGTSAFLEDSDSDGRSDRDEVTAGTDPNCPEGQTCGIDTSVKAAAATAVSTTPPPILPQFNAAAVRDQLRGAGLSDALLSSFSDQQLEEVYREIINEEQRGGTVSPASVPRPPAASALPSGDQLRQLLLQQGMPKEQLDSLSDNQLQQMMFQALQGNVSGP